MIILTTIGFFSIVQKPEDTCDDMLIIGSRVKSDLIALRDKYFSNLGPIVVHSSTDYQYRATALSSDVSPALEKLTLTIAYDNFKSAVIRCQDLITPINMEYSGPSLQFNGKPVELYVSNLSAGNNWQWD